MALFYTPPPGLEFDDLVERVAARVVDMYARIEGELLATVARRLARDLPASDDIAAQILVVRELQAKARELLANVPPDLAQQIVEIAETYGTSAAAAQMGLTEGMSRASLVTTSSASTLALVAQDLGSAFDALHLRILRYPIDAVGNFIGTDAYQQTVASAVGLRTVGFLSTDEVRKRVLADFLEQGITGFTDRLGRKWRIGSYSEMAVRSATGRAYTEASTHRIRAYGGRFVSILGNNDACKLCAPWFGKVLSIDGTPPGRYEVLHEAEDRLVVVDVAAMLDEARARGLMHPNCGCRAVSYAPGFDVPVSASHHDPVVEGGREQQRANERAIRDAKRKLLIADELGDEARAAKLRARIRALQAKQRDLVNDTGQQRRYDREQVRWADGPSSRPARPDRVDVDVTPPEPRDSPVVVPVQVTDG